MVAVISEYAEAATHEELDGARQAAALLKAVANRDRLLILCALTEGEKRVGELEALLGLRQPTLSQQLARLRSENLVDTRRDGKSIHYTIASPEAKALISLLCQMFHSPVE